MKDKLVLNVSEVSALLQISRASTYLAIRSGEIPHITIGKRILIPRLALEAKLAEAGQPKQG